MAPGYISTLNIIIGAILSIITAFIILRAENMKQIMARKHEFAVKDLGEKLFSPLLIELVKYESKKNLKRHHALPVPMFIDIITINQYLLLFTSDKVRNTINNIYIFATSTTSNEGNNVKTQDELIIQELRALRDELNCIYSKYRM